jgi:TatD DNase family protein
MIDTHCHFDFAKNPLEYISKNETNKIITIGMTNLPSHFNMGMLHVKRFKYIRLALGLHPLLAMEHEKEYANFLQNIDKTSYIGEVGLDYSREGIATKDMQIKSFAFVLNNLKQKSKLLSVHSRRAEETTFSMLSINSIENVIFHWYSGSIKLLSKILDRGYYFSINPAMVKSEHGKRVISEIPEERMLTETDYPFVKENILDCYQYLADLWKKETKEIESIIQSNFNRLTTRIRK